MKKCIKTDKPLVSILLAVYKPNEKWLIEQLVSLNEQTYENLNLFVYDDCPKEPVNEEIFRKYINKFNYKIIRGNINQGSNKAFEKLTEIADGQYFAYCDQDDIWERDKISLLMDKFHDDNVTLVFSDLSIIDENSIKTAESITKIRKRLIYKSGYNLASSLLTTNFVTGCTMIVKKSIVLKAIPFLNEFVHDQWIAIMAALNGKIEFVKKPLVRYRQHGNNQTGILKDIYNKKTYYKKRIDDFYEKYNALRKRIGNVEEVKENIENCLKWIEARKKYSLKLSFKEMKIMIKYREYHKVSILIEILLPFIPDFIFKYIIKLAKKGLL